MTEARIDRDKLHIALRKLGDEQVHYLLEEAIDLLPPAKLTRVIARYLDPAQLRPDGRRKGSLLALVGAFKDASLRGEFYESFNVNSRNYMDTSKGTRAWIAECHRLLDRAVSQANSGDPREVREAIEIILCLLRHIDECLDDVIFFADEGGSWQVCVDWAKVLPAWLACLAATSEPEDFARLALAIIGEFDHLRRAKHLAAAKKCASPAQRKALDVAMARPARRTR